MGEANNFVNKYIERLLLFKGASLGFGFSYQLKDGTNNQ